MQAYVDRSTWKQIRQDSHLRQNSAVSISCYTKFKTFQHGKKDGKTRFMRTRDDRSKQKKTIWQNSADSITCYTELKPFQWEKRTTKLVLCGRMPSAQRLKNTTTLAFTTKQRGLGQFFTKCAQIVIAMTSAYVKLAMVYCRSLFRRLSRQITTWCDDALDVTLLSLTATAAAIVTLSWPYYYHLS